MAIYADLHMHSCFSDGKHVPERIISKAERGGLSIIAITDHDTVSHLGPTIKAAGEVGLKVIPGLEFSTSYLDRELHILGYGLDYQDSFLVEILTKMQGRRVERVKKIIDKLRGEGLDIPDDELEGVPADCTIGRPHVARLLMKYNHVQTFGEAFLRYLTPDKPGFVPYELETSASIIELIQRTGGVSVLAHPSDKEVEEVLPELKKYGLDGVEAWRPRLRESQVQRVLDRASGLGLLVTGGSDWHYDNRNFHLGDFSITDEQIAPFLEKLENCRHPYF